MLRFALKKTKIQRVLIRQDSTYHNIMKNFPTVYLQKTKTLLLGNVQVLRTHLLANPRPPLQRFI